MVLLLLIIFLAIMLIGTPVGFAMGASDQHFLRYSGR